MHAHVETANGGPGGHLARYKVPESLSGRRLCWASAPLLKAGLLIPDILALDMQIRRLHGLRKGEPAS